MSYLWRMVSTPLLQILLFVGVGAVFIVSALLLSRLISPSKPNAEKNAPYESGEPAKGTAWPSISTGYYVLALLFLLFEVEIIMLFPLVVRLDSPAGGNAMWMLAEVVGFVLILAIGLGYAWANGHLDWMKPVPKDDDFKSPVPRDRYEDFNRRYK
jgi:NADH-quinone oxidoreductase subunit A